MNHGLRALTIVTLLSVLTTSGACSSPAHDPLFHFVLVYAKSEPSGTYRVYLTGDGLFELFHYTDCNGTGEDDDVFASSFDDHEKRQLDSVLRSPEFEIYSEDDVGISSWCPVPEGVVNVEFIYEREFAFSVEEDKHPETTELLQRLDSLYEVVLAEFEKEKRQGFF